MNRSGFDRWPVAMAAAMCVLIGSGAVVAWFRFGGPERFISWYAGARPAGVAPPAAAGAGSRLSALAPDPDWEDLGRYADTLTPADLRAVQERIYGDGVSSWDGWLEITGGAAPAAWIATVEADPSSPRIDVGLGRSAPPPRYWREASQLPPSSDPAARPLDGVRVAIDPGHIGGAWAITEERWYQPPDGPVAVIEGDLTLAVARLLKPSLEALGATVSMLRVASEPVTAMRPEDFDSQTSSRKEAELFFYRKAEIRARAAIVNEQIHPDIVVCLHFNAEPWGDPGRVEFVPANHLHLIVNGHYGADELALDDVRYEMLVRLLQRTEAEEGRLADAVSRSLAAATGLPPYEYQRGHLAGNAHRPQPDNPYVWARNLMANRLYQCPVVFCEPYVMNNREVYDRVAAGDYPGEKQVAGRLRKSLFREYADAVAAGLRAHFLRWRPPP